MKNLEIIILTSIICTLFIVFIVGPLFYAHSLTGNQIDPYKKQKTNRPQAEVGSFGFGFLKISRSLLEDRSISRKNKKNMIRVIQRTISDMESDGMYFPEEVKEELKKQREEICEYSGLPSVKSYERKQTI